MAQTKKRAGNGGKEEQGAAFMKVKDKLVRPASVWLPRGLDATGPGSLGQSTHLFLVVINNQIRLVI